MRCSTPHTLRWGFFPPHVPSLPPPIPLSLWGRFRANTRTWRAIHTIRTRVHQRHHLNGGAGTTTTWKKSNTLCGTLVFGLFLFPFPSFSSPFPPSLSFSLPPLPLFLPLLPSHTPFLPSFRTFRTTWWWWGWSTGSRFRLHSWSAGIRRFVCENIKKGRSKGGKKVNQSCITLYVQCSISFSHSKYTTYIQLCTYICMYVCMYVDVFMYVHICTHMYSLQ